MLFQLPSTIDLMIRKGLRLQALPSKMEKLTGESESPLYGCGFNYHVMLGVSLGLLILVGGILFIGGVVTGLTGFGYALISTTTLAVVLDPQTAVVLMIVPVIVANLDLIRELDRASICRCVRRFQWFIVSAAVGTLVGMALLRQIPTDALMLILGIIVIGYVAISQDLVSASEMDRLAAYAHSTESINLGIGFLGGVIFGGSNVGVPIVAFLDSLDLDRSTFVGVVALILLGISVVRVGMAWLLGLYGPASLLWLSVVVAGPGLIGVIGGQRLRNRLPTTYVERFVQILLLLIGIRLILSSVGLF